MIKLTSAIDHATENMATVSEIVIDKNKRKSFFVSRGFKSLKVEHVGGKRWQIVGHGKPETQAHCIIDAVTILRDGEPVI